MLAWSSVNERIRGVFRNRLWTVAFALYTALQLALLAFPVSRIPGYELATGLGLLTALLGGMFGIAFGRQESMRAATTPTAQVLAAVSAAALTLLAPLAVTVLLAVVFTTTGSPCSPFAAFEFLPVTLLPDVAVVAALGVWVGLRFKRWWGRGLAWLGVVLASALHTTWPIVFGPQVSAWNHLAGFLPGPLYDEELHLPTALLWFRLGSLLLAGFGVFGAMRTYGARTKSVTVGLATTAGTLVVLELLGPTLGFRMSDDALAARLGGMTESEHVVLMHPRGLTPKEVSRALGDLELRFGQIARFVGGAPPGKVRVWWYRTAEQKQQLVGAAHTQFAKPWRREIHVNDMGFPHPVAKHELAHALLGPLGARPFGVTARLGGLSPHVGVIEGMAVAADNPVDDLTLEQWAAAMKKQAMLPDVRTLLEPQGFYSAPASRAYTTAGAFLRWLQETRGAEQVRALYRDGDFERVFGVPLATLVDAWEQHLDGVALEPEAVNQAFARFRRGSLFDRTCAREVASLTAEVGELTNDDGPAALELLGRCEALQPDEPSHVLSRASTLRRLGRDDDARALLEGLATKAKDAPSTWADAAMALVDLHLAKNEDAPAKELLTRVLEARISPAMDRTARVRLHSLESTGAVRVALTRYFAPDGDAVQVHWLERARAERPDDAFVAYLLGRKLHQREAFAEAMEALDVARTADGVPASIRRETVRLMLEASWGTGDCARITVLADEAASLSAQFGLRARDWVERCEARGAP